jgi:hypothetical protein
MNERSDGLNLPPLGEVARRFIAPTPDLIRGKGVGQHS